MTDKQPWPPLELLQLGWGCDAVEVGYYHEKNVEPLVELYQTIKSWQRYGNLLPNGEIALAFHKCRELEEKNDA